MCIIAAHLYVCVLMRERVCAGARKLAMGTRGARKKKALRKKVARVTENKYNENRRQNTGSRGFKQGWGTLS